MDPITGKIAANKLSYKIEILKAVMQNPINMNESHVEQIAKDNDLNTDSFYDQSRILAKALHSIVDEIYEELND